MTSNTAPSRHVGLFSSLLLSLQLLSYLICESTAQIELSNVSSYDGYVLNGSLSCQSNYGLEGRFRFLGNTAEAYWHVESGFVYFEYLFPSIVWTGFGASNQSIPSPTSCLSCYFSNNNEVSSCLDECLTGQTFVITGEGDPNSDALLTWNTIETIITNNGNSSSSSQFPLPLTLLNESFYDEFRDFVTLPMTPNVVYIHGWWYKSFSNKVGDEWNVPLSGDSPICWTSIASSDSEEYYGQTTSHVDKTRVEIHCNNVTNVCEDIERVPTIAPTVMPADIPTPRPTSAPTFSPIPEVTLDVELNICSMRNLSVILFLDASNSITDNGWNDTLEWAVSMLDQFNEEMGQAKTSLNSQLDTTGDIEICLRASVVQFAVDVQVLFDLNQFGGCYDAEQGATLIRAATRPDRLSRLTGTHHKDAIETAISQVGPQIRGADARLMIMATDGRSKDVSGSVALQNPCQISDNNSSRYILFNDIEFMVVGIEGFAFDDDENFNAAIATFECLMDPTADRSYFILEDTEIQFETISDEIESNIYDEYCARYEEYCPIPLYPSFDFTNVPLFEEGLYEITNVSLEFETLYYTFTVTDNTPFGDEVETLYTVKALSLPIYATSCDSGNSWELEARIFEWTQGPMQAELLAASETSISVTGDDGIVVYNFTFDFENDDNLVLSEEKMYTITIESVENDCDFDDFQWPVARIDSTAEPASYNIHGYFEDLFYTFDLTELGDNNDIIYGPLVPQNFLIPLVTVCLDTFTISPNPTEMPTGITIGPTKEGPPSPTSRPTSLPSVSSAPTATTAPTTPTTPTQTTPPTESPSVPTAPTSSRAPTAPPIDPTEPTMAPTAFPAAVPTESTAPTESPSTPTTGPTTSPTTGPPSTPPTVAPTQPTPEPTQPTPKPTDAPSSPTTPPTKAPTPTPTAPTSEPTPIPTAPTASPTTPSPTVPIAPPTRRPTGRPTARPTNLPTVATPTQETPAPTTSEDCPLPYEFPRCGLQCVVNESEWRVSFVEWNYDDKKEATTFVYEICTMKRLPFNSENCDSDGDDEPNESEVFFLSIPCLCEVCIPDITMDVEPEGVPSSIYQGWIWYEKVKAGDCNAVGIKLDGYVPVGTGTYYLYGDDRYIVDEIQVPDPCVYREDVFEIYDKDEDDSSSSSSENGTDTDSTDSSSEGCLPRYPMLPMEYCDLMCDWEETEYSILFLDNSYDNNTDTTTFKWNISVSTSNVDGSCNLEDEPVTLEHVYIRLGCQCAPQSQTFLRSITKAMEPSSAEVSDLYWAWFNLEIEKGQMKTISLTLSGGDYGYDYGDATVINKNGVCSSNWMIEGVPNPCNLECLYGQWGDWIEYGACNQDCNGGYQYHYRKCYSICDAVTEVDNCLGKSHGFVPCNTQSCDVFKEQMIEQHFSMSWQK